MSVKGRQGPTKRLFAALYYDFIDGPEMGAASSGATRLLILLMRRHNGYNASDIPCSVREAADWCHCSKSTALGYFSELRNLGLIEPTRLGSFTIKKGELKNVSTRWRLIFLPVSAAEHTDA